MLTVFLLLLQASQALSAAPAPHVVAERLQQPPPGGAWVGAEPHRFMNGQVEMFCGSHGVFSGGGEPPRQKGQSTIIEYGAEFKGEIKLNPPLARTAQTFTIKEHIRMTEWMTLDTTRGADRLFTTELIAVDFSGASFPERIIVREARGRRSMGKASMRRNQEGRFEIQGSYQVWLEISVDGGRSWHLADNGVRMVLKPETGTVKPTSDKLKGSE